MTKDNSDNLSIVVDKGNAPPPHETKATPKGGLVAASSRTTTVIIAYMLCSSLMLVVNKGAVYLLPVPSLLLSLQTGFSALVVWSAGKLGYLNVDALVAHKAKAYALVVCVCLFLFVIVC